MGKWHVLNMFLLQAVNILLHRILPNTEATYIAKASHPEATPSTPLEKV